MLFAEITDICDVLVEYFVGLEGEDRHFDGGDFGFETKIGSFFVPHFERVLQHAVQDTSKPKGRFDNAGNKFLFTDINYFLFEF